MHIPALGGGGEKEEKPGRERRKPLPNWPDQNVTQEQEMSHAGRAAAPRHLHRKKPHQAGNRRALLLVPAPHAPAPQPPAPLLRLLSPIGTPRPARAASPESITPATRLAVQPWIWPFNLRLGHSILHLPRPKVEFPSIVVPPLPVQSPFASPRCLLCPVLWARGGREKAQHFCPKRSPSCTSIAQRQSSPKGPTRASPSLHPAHRPSPVPSCWCRMWVSLDPNT